MTGQRFLVADAHGRLLDLAPANNQAPQGQQFIAAPPDGARRQRVGSGIAIAAVLAGGAVLCVLLFVIRDIVTTVAGGSITGLLLQSLLRLVSRRER